MSRLDEIEDRLIKTTPGEWFVGHHCVNSRIFVPNEDGEDDGLDDEIETICEKAPSYNAKFIAHSKGDIGWLIARVCKLEEALSYPERRPQMTSINSAGALDDTLAMLGEWLDIAQRALKEDGE